MAVEIVLVDEQLVTMALPKAIDKPAVVSIKVAEVGALTTTAEERPMAVG